MIAIQQNLQSLNLKSSPVKLRLKDLKIIVIAALILVILVGLFIWLKPSAKPTARVNQSFSVQARTREKLRVRDANLQLTVTTADFANSLLVQGRKATARNEKVFLILNMEVENPYEAPLYTFPVDIVRLVRSDGKLLAPSVTQGTVEVRPISIKRTNVGFIVEPKEKKFKLELGEVGKEVQTIEITFK